MALTYTYTLSLQDKMSTKLKAITGSSVDACNKFEALGNKVKMCQNKVADFGGSIDSLRSKIDLLQAERDLIDPSNLDVIKKYNKEIKGLEKSIEKLEKAGTGGGLKGLFGKMNDMSGGLLTSDTALGAAAVGFAAKGAFTFAENMAKVNVTAQLDEKSLNDAYSKVFAITKQNKGDIDIAPVALEKIISQTGDAALSMDILDASMKGARGGFVDIDTVSGALAQSLSIIGKENANAQEVLDTFFAAKRVGAGEFADFARYMPNLIAGASNLGMGYKEVGGIFAYMTGKGQSAERAAVLMENAFGILGRGEVQEGMAKFGVEIFDTEGKMRAMLDVARDINAVTTGKSDKQKSNILESMGLKDKEAKNAFAILTADTDKLASSLQDVANSSGETEKAISFSKNPMQNLSDIINGFKTPLIELGVELLPIFNGALWLVGTALTPVVWLIEALSWGVGVLSDGLESGNPFVWGFAAAVASATVALTASTVAAKAKALWDSIAAGATKVWTWAQHGLNAAFKASPIGLITTGIGFLVSAIMLAWDSFEGFRKAIYGCWEVTKLFGSILLDAIMSPIRNIIDGLGSIGKAIALLFKGDFDGAWNEAKSGAMSLAKLTPAVQMVEMGVNLAKADWSGAWDKGQQAGAESRTRSRAKTEEKNDKDVPFPGAPSGLANRYPSSLGGSTDGDKDTFNLNNINGLKGSTAYGAIISKLQPLKMATMTAAASAMLAVPSSEATTMPQVGDNTEYAENKKNITMQKFCDSIVIQIDKADSKGYNQIQQEVEAQLKKMLDEYDA